MTTPPYTVEKSVAGTDLFGYGDAGFVNYLTKRDGCAVGWYAHRGPDGSCDMRGPFSSREDAASALQA